MTKYFFYILLFSLLSACGLPSNFTNYCLVENTNLEERINMDGVYISPFNCDSSLYTVYTFYANGIFLSATTDSVSEDIISCFKKGGTSANKNYPLWGAYRIVGDTIKTQSIRKEGNGCIIFRDYLITPNKNLINISDYVEPEQTNLAYMKNYPSFRNNLCASIAKFISLDERRDSADCPFLHKKNL